MKVTVDELKPGKFVAQFDGGCNCGGCYEHHMKYIGKGKTHKEALQDFVNKLDND